MNEISDWLSKDPVTPELDPYLPSLAAGLRQAVLDDALRIRGDLVSEGRHRIGCPCAEQLEANVAFLSAMDDADLARYFGRWVREVGVRMWLLGMLGRNRCDPEPW